ncbi:hypothetical protein [Candidatus Solirubrobacter pratensis]|uniref:hypothetical protein n=1 Tax=Candidatus Solirubrobacter pratensis TaxID=1298857 RepID=UPI0012DE549F|nr:hypothetical protein [Candidatus Solirubrobacter pratensis]
MSAPYRRVAALAAAVSTLAILAPGAGVASAQDGGGTAAIALLGWQGTPSIFMDGAVIGQMAAVIGPVVITTAPATFLNSNDQIAAGVTSIGVQVSGVAAGNR